MGRLTRRRNGQVIASLLIIQRVANRSALTRDTIATGSSIQLRAHSQKGLAGENPVSSVGQQEVNSSGELVFGVKPVMDIRRGEV